MSTSEENKSRISSTNPEIIKAYVSICGDDGVITLKKALEIVECDSIEKLQEVYPDQMALTRALGLAIANVMAYTEDLHAALTKAGVKIDVGIPGGKLPH